VIIKTCFCFLLLIFFLLFSFLQYKSNQAVKSPGSREEAGRKRVLKRWWSKNGWPTAVLLYSFTVVLLLRPRVYTYVIEILMFHGSSTLMHCSTATLMRCYATTAALQRGRVTLAAGSFVDCLFHLLLFVFIFKISVLWPCSRAVCSLSYTCSIVLSLYLSLTQSC